MSKQGKAFLRVCASCEWIFKGNHWSCPKCKFGSYGAHYVYGSKCYNYAKNQKPWIERQLSNLATKLIHEVQRDKK